MASIDARIASVSASSIRPCTVLRIRIGGSAGFKTIIALPWLARPMISKPRAVVSVNSSIFCRVPGPALLLAMVATISAYSTGATCLSALHQRHGRLAAAADQVEIVRADMFVEVDQRHDVGTDGGGSQIDGDLIGRAQKWRVFFMRARRRGVENDIETVRLFK